MKPKKFSGKAVLAVILCILLLVGGEVKLYSDKREQQIVEKKKKHKKAAYTLHNPKIENYSSAESRRKK